MLTPPPLCSCEVCTTDAPDAFTTPMAAIRAVCARDRRSRRDRVYCPRCGEMLGLTEALVDDSGCAHLVQPCGACAALWVL